MIEPTIDCFGFVVDTNQYAGNFDRDLGRYLKLNLELDVVDMNCDFDSFTSIYPTPNWYNNGLGFNYQKGQEALAVEKYKEQCEETGNVWIANIRRTENELLSGKVVQGWTLDDCDREIQRNQRYIANGPLGKMPTVETVSWGSAYNSVVIYLTERPTAQMIVELKELSIEFLANKKIVVENFRLVEFTVNHNVDEIVHEI